ncbi:hypothetical protein [Bradyrhizobium sp. Ash2021]|uniref:hypothetical protein n=1 Tax=Bradyrhizobium sp. Ash2021 TaxID=2954771 RepID=UPI002815B897|nr:hypothetical protein [Bradyrhizobium sp. Ash2021]WMT78747.1 hypothetical protein NL528_21450 [Bradyrhizobium sp. Ash2021]
MEIARLELDRIAGLATGHAGKLLSRSPVKRMGMQSLGPILQTLGLIIMVVEDPAARDKTLARRTPVYAPNVRNGNTCNSKKQLPPPEAPTKEKPALRLVSTEPPSRSHLRVIQPRRKGSKACHAAS